MNTNLLPIGTRVHHTGHGSGTIDSYNGFKPSTYVNQNLGKPVLNAAIGAGLVDAVISSLYNGMAYPYVVKFDSGYQDVYSVDDVTEIQA